MQSATGGGEATTGIGVDAGRTEVDRRIFVFVGAAGVVCAEPGGRRSGQAGYGSGAAQIERAARAAECGSGGGVRAVGSGTSGDGGERSGGTAGFVWIKGARAESLDSRDV